MEWIAIGDAAHEPPVKAYLGCQPERAILGIIVSIISAKRP
jgi:hypothetical protein